MGEGGCEHGGRGKGWGGNIVGECVRVNTSVMLPYVYSFVYICLHGLYCRFMEFMLLHNSSETKP